MRRLALCTLLALALPAAGTRAAGAQDSPGTLLDALAPNRLAQALVQSGLLALRTQIDFKYEGLRVDLLAGRLVLSDLRIWPMPPWAEGDACLVTVRRLTLSGAGLRDPDRMQLGLLAEGVTVPGACLDAAGRAPLALLGLERLELSRLNLSLDYHLPSAGAEVHGHAAVAGVGTAEARAEFSYLWFDGRADPEEPQPVVYLRHAQIRLENGGAWQRLAPLLPPDLTGPMAGRLVEGLLREALDGLGAPDGGPDGAPPGPAEEAFLRSAAAAWPAFLADPAALVIETAIPDADVFLDLEALADHPRAAIEALRPVVALAPRAVTELIPAALLRGALAGDAAMLTAAERRRVGLALVTGRGAPRNLSAGAALLAPFAEAGDGQAALALSRALEARAPDEAYRFALLAGAAATPGAAARLDALEAAVGLARALEVQARVTPAAPDTESAETLADMRARAAARISGLGLARSYRHAAFWALLGAAAGDAESAALLEEIDARVSAAGPAARAGWAALESEAAAAAAEFWIGRDLPRRLAR